MKKMLVTLILASLLLFGLAGTSLAADYKVMMNGSYLVFTDAVPQNVDGRVVLPFRAILEALGADVQWDAKMKTVTAVKGDTTVDFKVGDSILNIAGKDWGGQAEMDVVPFIQNGRTYAGVRFLADAFGYNVGWDDANNTVILIDPTKIAENADSDFSILKSMSENTASEDGAYNITGDFEVNVTLGAGDEAFKSSVNGQISGKAKGQDANIMMSATTTENGTSATKNVEIISDMQDAIAYIKGTGEEMGFDADTWMKIDLTGNKANVAAMASGNVAGLISDSIDEESLTIDSYNDLQTSYNIIKSIIGNKAFKVKDNVATLTVDGASIVNAIVRNAEFSKLFSGMTSTDFAEMRNVLSGFELTLKITTNADGTQTAVFNGTLSVEGLNGQLNITADGDRTANIQLKVDSDFINVDGTVNAAAEKTDEDVVIALPEGAKVEEMPEDPEVIEYDENDILSDEDAEILEEEPTEAAETAETAA